MTKRSPVGLLAVQLPGSLGQLSFPSLQGEIEYPPTGWGRAGRFHLCWVAGNTVCSHMAGYVPQLCHGSTKTVPLRYTRAFNLFKRKGEERGGLEFALPLPQKVMDAAVYQSVSCDMHGLCLSQSAYNVSCFSALELTMLKWEFFSASLS